MCTAIKNGGRRCPIHQRNNVVAIKIASHLGGLTVRQTERLFAELRREGRDAEVLTETQQEASLQSLKEAATDTTINDSVVAELAAVPAAEAETDGASGYAQRLIIQRSKVRGENLSKRFREVAETTGYTEAEVAEKFEEFYSQVDISRGAAVPEEYNQNTRRAAVLANLPYDKASVVAFEKLKKLNPVQNERRVTHQQAAEGSHIKSFGYDDGRLEVVFNSNPDVIYAYQNVPDEVWERFSETSAPGRVYAREIRGNQDYMYETREASEQDAFRQRCAACGQFRAAVHTCEEREHRAELEEAGLTPDQIREEVETEQADLPASMINVEDDSNTSDGNIAKTVEENTPADEEKEEVDSASTIQDEPPTETILPASLTYVAPDSDESGLPSLINYSPTSSLQRKPVAYDTSALVITKRSEPYQRIVTVNSSTLDSDIHYNDYIKNLPKETLTLIKNSSPDNLYVIGKKSVDSDAVEVIEVFDNKKVSVEKNFYHGRNDEGLYVTGYTYSTSRRGKKYDPTPISSEEKRSAMNAENDKLSDLVDTGKASIIPLTTTKTRKYLFDGNLNKQPLIAAGNATAFKRAIKENKIAVLPLTVEYSNRITSNSVDDQGYEFGVAPGTTVTGEVAFQRNPKTGVMEPVVTTENKLRCSCYDYRQKYRCEHINHVFRHAGNVAQQMLPIAASGTEPGSSSGRGARVDAEGRPLSRLLTTSLANRPDVSIMTDKSGEEYVSFGETLGYDARSSYGNDAFTLMHLPEDFKPVDENNPTSRELDGITEYVEFAKSITRINAPRSLTPARTALKRSDVSIPVSARFGWRGDAMVTGSMRLSRIERNLEETTVKESNLKCTCQEYAASYTCSHVRFVVQQPFPFIAVGARNQQAESNSLQAIHRKYSELIARERDIRGVMMRLSMSREQAEIEIVTRQETEARAERERDEARRRRRIQAAAAEAEYERARAERVRAAKEEALKKNQKTIDESAQYRERMLKRWENKEEGYSKNSKEFYSDYKSALKRKRNKEEVIPFRTENVTDGICADEPGARRFGVELEFDIKRGVNRGEALRKIGEELHAAGLTSRSDQTAYHSAAGNGYSKWSFEEDCTVDAELVSPIMKDTPEDWEQLRTAIEIINRNGGQATTKAGSHVHVSTASYEHSSAKHLELMRIMKQNEDTMYRLASDPSRGTHRGTNWCKPNVLGEHGDISEEVANGNRIFGYNTPSHGYMMNLSASADQNYEKSNVEFRVWDATLDPAVIQQQIAISVAAVDYAERSTILNKGSKKPSEGDKLLGASKQVETETLAAKKIKSHTEETFVETHKEVASFFDKLFRRKEDRANAMSLFAVTNWQDSPTFF